MNNWKVQIVYHLKAWTLWGKVVLEGCMSWPLGCYYPGVSSRNLLERLYFGGGKCIFVNQKIKLKMYEIHVVMTNSKLCQSQNMSNWQMCRQVLALFEHSLIHYNGTIVLKYIVIPCDLGWSRAYIYDSSVGWLEITKMSMQPTCYLYWKKSK